MTFYAISALVNFLTTLFLGFIVLIRNPRSKLNFTFFIFSLDVSLWSLCYYIWQISTTEASALFWSKALMAFAIFIPVFYLNFIIVLLRREKSKAFFLVAAYLIFTIFLFADIFSPYFIPLVKSIGDFKFWPVAGPLYLFFVVLWVGLMVYNAFFLYSIQEGAEGLLKLQIKYVFIGFVIGLIGGITNYFMWFGIPIPPIGNILVTVYVGLNAYAIIKHSFFDIKLIVARTVSFALLTGLIGLLYALLFGILSSVFINSALEVRTITVSTMLALIMAFSFQTLRRILERLSDKLFYKGGYDSNKLLSRLGSIMSVNIELEPLTSQIIQTLIEQMRISKGAFVILGEGPTSIYDIIDVGFSKKLFLNFNQISPFLSLYQTIVFDELEENNLKNLMRELEVSVIKNLRVNNQPVGLLLLGEKASGEIYSDQDLKILEILVPEVVIAIQNAQSYDKIKKFNITLSEEVKKATKDLQIVNTKLKVLDQLKDDFVSIASHELRTPMTAIRSYAWMALHRSEVPISPNVEKYLVRILISTERLINLVNDMLNISRIESGKIEIKPEPIDLVSLSRDIVDEIYYSKAIDKNVNFSLLEEQVPKVFADPEKLRQVLLNIMGNALKFSPLGGQITIGFFTDGQTVEIYIKDEGPGISREDIGRLFQKFGRLDSSYTADAVSGGTGLGLYISKSLLELMKGKIWVTSEGLGKGSTFALSLPVATPEILKDAEKYTVKARGEVKGLETVAI